MASFLDVCRFNPTSNGTGSFVVSSAVNGYQTPALAGAVNGATYRYRAESADLTQWEVGYGVYTVSTTTLTRGTVLYNSAGTGTGSGQSGAGSLINFTLVPQVGITFLAEDLRPPTISTALVAGASTGTGGFVSGTYTTPVGVTWIEIQLVGGGGGGISSGVSPGASTAGGNTTFGSLTGGGGNVGAGTQPGGGGSASGGSAYNIVGSDGFPSPIAINTATEFIAGGNGGSSFLGGGGAGGTPGASNGNAGKTNSGSGGGGGSGNLVNSGGGGGSGGFVKSIIISPSATYSYSVGSGGSGGTAGSGGQAGGSGAIGQIIVIEHYGS